MKQVSVEISNLPIGKEKSINRVGEPDHFAARVVNSIMRELRGIHPAWRSAVKNEQEYECMKRNYIKAMMEQGICTMEQVERGLEFARQNKSDFLPGPGKFCSWCLDDGEMHKAFERMAKRKKSRSALEKFIRNECEFDCRQLSEDKALSLFKKTYIKYKRLEREGKLPSDFVALPVHSVTTDFDRLRNDRGVPDPNKLKGVFQRIALLGQPGNRQGNEL